MNVLSGWEFVDTVMATKQTFRGFVTCYINRYRRSNPDAPSFMSTQTFIDWFFAWASHMNIEFREKCHWCGDQSPLVACDGTKIGIGLRNAFVEPIETTTNNKAIPTPNRRYDRTFITNLDPKNSGIFKEARMLLKKISNDILHPASNPSADSNAVDALMAILPEASVPAFTRMNFDPSASLQVKKAYAKVFKLLSQDASVDALIPLAETDGVIAFCRKCFSKKASESEYLAFCEKMWFVCPEFVELLRQELVSFKEVKNSAVTLLHYCALFVEDYHQTDIEPEAPVVLPNTYNPARFGRAYYFESHGCQIRKNRNFSMDTQSAKNFDDVPNDNCQKRFPQVNKKGTCYLFLFFCPIHGHCLGFHVITGSEGRKDPAAALYTHMEKAPKAVFYDFACSLSEYCHNRESGYFKDTKFFHDVFHGFTHVCSQAFRCNRLPIYDSANTSICEQFNSFLQKLKSSSKLMTQSHFMFYVQFFIHIWNMKKKEAFERKLTIAKKALS